MKDSKSSWSSEVTSVGKVESAGGRRRIAHMALSPRQRALLWVFSTLLFTAPLMGVTMLLARLGDLPIIILFAPAVLLGTQLGAQTPLHGVYYMMPVQCVVYGLIMAQSELAGRRTGTAIGLLLAHSVILARVLGVCGASIPT